ncbi:MAG: hypothetical protein R8K46_01725 [Mariprofundaceae bacterium]
MNIRWSDKPIQGGYALLRRGLHLGFVVGENDYPPPESNAVVEAWKNDIATLLPGFVDLHAYRADIEQAHTLMARVLDGESPADLFDTSPYAEQLISASPEAAFTLVASIHDESDPQEIEKVLFDAEKKEEVAAEDLWCKASWLSYHDEDASLRFRFSFGMEGHEDVAADPARQQWAAGLCDALFPESRAITANPDILKLLHDVLDGDPAFVERIVYFNAPNGGAQLHHDVERGHAGVIYAQISGNTFWLALDKQTLIDEIIAFVNDPLNTNAITQVLPSDNDRSSLHALASDRRKLSDYMEEFDHELIEALIDRSPEFSARLVEQGYAHILHPGDAILLPQRDLETCVWHSVFCLGEDPGEGLSFALR